MGPGTLEEEEAVVIHELFASVEMEEGGDVPAALVINELEHSMRQFPQSISGSRITEPRFVHCFNLHHLGKS